MDVFKSFSFGRLIKTFLPGFVCLLSAILIVDGAISLMIGNSHPILDWAQANPVIATALAIPWAIILGILCNTLFFLYLAPVFIKSYYRKHASDFVRSEEEIIDYLLAHHACKVIPVGLLKKIRGEIDDYYFTLPYTSVEKVVFLQESFWDYHEFQLNLAFVLLLFSCALLFHLWVDRVFVALDASTSIAVVAVAVLLTMTISLLLLRAARTNYDSHRKRSLSLILGAFAQSMENQPPEKAQVDLMEEYVNELATEASHAP